MAGRLVAPIARSHHIPKQKHRVTNWAEYDAGLRARGSLTVGFVNSVSYKACVIVRQYGPELHAAIRTHVSRRHIRKASARARRY